MDMNDVDTLADARCERESIARELRTVMETHRACVSTLKSQDLTEEERVFYEQCRGTVFAQMLTLHAAASDGEASAGGREQPLQVVSNMVAALPACDS